MLLLQISYAICIFLSSFGFILAFNAITPFIKFTREMKAQRLLNFMLFLWFAFAILIHVAIKLIVTRILLFSQKCKSYTKLAEKTSRTGRTLRLNMHTWELQQ